MKNQKLILVMIVLFCAFWSVYSFGGSWFHVNSFEGMEEPVTPENIGAKLQELITTQMGVDEKKNENTSKKTEKIEGFETYGSSYSQTEKPEIFSKLEGGCNINTQFPYTNSKGYLCMTDEAVKLLSTRGGNAV